MQYFPTSVATRPVSPGDPHASKHGSGGSAFLTVDATHVYFWVGQQILRAPR
ncbi:MAG TPA: hypothetical protein VGL19_04355 [Polyangiaceae bacterium]